MLHKNINKSRQRMCVFVLYKFIIMYKTQTILISNGSKEI